MGEDARPGSQERFRGRLRRIARLRRPGRRTLVIGTLMVVGVILLPVLGAGVALRLEYSGDLRPDTRTRGRDAVWLGHAWVDGRRNGKDLARLAARIRGTGVRDLYAHTGPLEYDGSLDPGLYPRAKWLLAGVHRRMPGIRVHAWLGQRLALDGRHTQKGLTLERAATRERVLESSRQVLDTGFDGVHFDFEPLHSGRDDYLGLMDDVRAVTRARDVPLSVAVHQIDPLPELHSAAGFLTGRPKWWSQGYFAQVARRVDQIAVMSYDTALPLESLYGGYVAQQTALALEVTPQEVDLLMGLPAYHTDDIGHHESAETVAAAVRGARLGLGRKDADRERFGVALYIDFAATEGDWSAYRRGWGSTGE